MKFSFKNIQENVIWSMSINSAVTNRLCSALGIDQFLILNSHLAIANAVMEKWNFTFFLHLQGRCS